MTNKEELNTLELEILANMASGMSVTESLAPMLKRVMEVALNTEIEEFMSTNESKQKKNRRNGKARKTVKTSHGSFELETPRDRYSEFEPQTVKKRQTFIPSDMENKILSLYCNGISYSDIQETIKDIFQVDVSKATISNISNKILDELKDWKSRPLDEVYPIVFMDAIHFKVRVDGRVQTKAGYTLLGIDTEGKRDILGLYLSESESASFWSQVIADLKNRGIKDILIACIDGLKGFSKAILTHFPECEVQRCIIHQIRHSMKYITSKDRKEFMNDLKLIYQAPNLDVAQDNLLQLDHKWSKKYGIVINFWNNNWSELSTYFKYDESLKKIIYTTNMIENLHRNIRKYTKSKGAFTSEEALQKLMFCAFKKSNRRFNKKINNWAIIISQLDIHFPNRLQLDLT